MEIVTKRVYEPAAKADGYRVLVDRLWPRGVSRQRAAIALWAKELTPSTELRTWFAHRPERFAEFARRYRQELADREAIASELVAAAEPFARLTLVYAARDNQCNHAQVLKDWLLTTRSR